MSFVERKDDGYWTMYDASTFIHESLLASYHKFPYGSSVLNGDIAFCLVQLPATQFYPARLKCLEGKLQTLASVCVSVMNVCHMIGKQGTQLSFPRLCIPSVEVEKKEEEKKKKKRKKKRGGGGGVKGEGGG